MSRTEPFAPMNRPPTTWLTAMNSAGIGLAVPVQEVHPAADLVVAVPLAVGPVDLGDLARARVDEAAEVAAQELLGLPAGQPLAGVGQEREAGLLVDRPDEVRRVLDEVAVARLRPPQERVEPGVAHRDRGLVAEHLEEPDRLVVDLVDGPEGDRQRAHDLAGRGPQRDGRHAADAQPGGHVLVLLLVGDPRVHEVVVRADRATERRGQPVQPAVERELEVEHPPAGVVVDAGRHDRPEVAAVLDHEREVGAVGADEPAGFLHDELEDLVRVAQGGDPGRDLAQRALVIGQSGELAPRDVEVVDEPGVGDGDGRLGGEAPDEVGVALAEARSRSSRPRGRPADRRRRRSGRRASSGSPWPRRSGRNRATAGTPRRGRRWR